MMNWPDALVASIAIICGLALLLAPVACTINRQRLVAETIKSTNADPQAIKCAIESVDMQAQAVCLALVMQGKK